MDDFGLDFLSDFLEKLKVTRRPAPPSSDQYAAYSREKDSHVWIKYDPEVRQDIREWLLEYPPSKITTYNGEPVGYFYVKNRSLDASEPSCNAVRRLKRDWEIIKEHKKCITAEDLQTIGLNHGVVGGEWLIYVEPGDAGDEMWSRIARETINGSLSDDVVAVKISSVPRPQSVHHDKRQVLCVYTRDFTDTDNVYKVERLIRQLGITKRMCYKLSLYTYLNIYRNNEWALRAATFYSNYHDNLKTSVIIPASQVAGQQRLQSAWESAQKNVVRKA